MIKSKWDSSLTDGEEVVQAQERKRNRGKNQAKNPEESQDRIEYDYPKVEPTRWNSSTRHEKDFDNRKKIDKLNPSDEERAEYWRSKSVLQYPNYRKWNPQRVSVTFPWDMSDNFPNYDRIVTIKKEYPEYDRKKPTTGPPYDKCSLKNSMRSRRYVSNNGRVVEERAYEDSQGHVYFWKCNRESQFPVAHRSYVDNVLYWAESNKEEAKKLHDGLQKAMWRWEKEALKAKQEETSRKDNYPEVTKLLKQDAPLNVAPYSVRKIQIPASPTSTVKPVIDHPATKRTAINLPPHSLLPVTPIEPPAYKAKTPKRVPLINPFTSKFLKPRKVSKAPPAPKIGIAALKLEAIKAAVPTLLPQTLIDVKSIETMRGSQSILTPSVDVPPAIPQINLPELERDLDTDIIELDTGEKNVPLPDDRLKPTRVYGRPIKNEPRSPTKEGEGGLANLERFYTDEEKARRIRAGLDPEHPRRWTKSGWDLIPDTRAMKKAASAKRRSIAAKTNVTLNELLPASPYYSYPETSMETDSMPERILIRAGMTEEELTTRYPNIQISQTSMWVFLQFPDQYKGGEQRTQPSKKPGWFYFDGKLVQSGLWDPSKQLILNKLPPLEEDIAN